MQAQMERLPRLEFSFVNAVDGRTLPDTICVALAGKFWVKSKGTIGCFLSHVRIWECVAQQNEPFVVVLEDDVSVKKLSTLWSIKLPENFDIVFINDRMSPGFAADQADFVDMATALRHLDMRKGAGSDGYLLTPSAARKMLTAIEQDGYAGHIDGRLLRYASSEADVEALEPDSYTAIVMRSHHGPRPPALGLLKGYATTLPLVRNVAWHSTREAMNTPPSLAAAGQAQTTAAAITVQWPEAFTSTPPALEASWIDHALRKPASQSSLSDWSVGADMLDDAGRAVLGEPQPPYAFHTNFEDRPWWQVDLGGTRLLKHVVVVNRYDNIAFASRATPLIGEVSDDGSIWREIFRTPNGLFFGTGTRQMTWTSLEILKARHLRLSVARRSCLHLAQVQVFGPAQE
jgi:hypothetical protein